MKDTACCSSVHAAQDMVLFLQRLPTGGWGEKEVETVLSRAYMWRSSFDQAQSHLATC